MSLQLPTSNGIATFSWRYLGTSQFISVTCGYFDSLGNNDANLHATTFWNELTQTGCPCIAANMTVDWQFQPVTTQLKTTTGFLVIGAGGTVVNGSATAAPNVVPIFTPYVVSKKTAFAGRAFRGRMYPPFTNLLEGSVDAAGGITPGAVTTLQNQWNAFKALNDLSNVPMRLLHTDAGVGTPAPNAIAALTVRPVTGIQRRRRARGA